MPLHPRRVAPLPESEWGEEGAALLAPFKRDGKIYNIFATLVRHPKLLKRWLGFADHILGKSEISPRDREIAILRIGWLSRAEYEWGHHVHIGKKVGLTDDDIHRIADGPDAPGWDPFEAAIVRAADDLARDCRISDATWADLSKKYNERQLMDLVFTIGQYRMVSMALNTLGVELEEGFGGLDGWGKR